MPKYRNDRSDQSTIFAGGKSFLYGATEEIDHYVYDPDLVLVSHVPTARAIRPTESKLDVLIENDLTINDGQVKRAGPFNLEMFDFEEKRSFALLVKGTGPAAAELTVDVRACRASGSGEAWPFTTTVVPVSGEAITDFYREFTVEKTEAIVLDFSASGGNMVLSETVLFF